MTERHTPLQAYRCVYLCDVCGSEMESTGHVLLSFPPQYPHRCSNDHSVILGSSYPRIEYLPYTGLAAASTTGAV